MYLQSVVSKWNERSTLKWTCDWDLVERGGLTVEGMHQEWEGGDQAELEVERRDPPPG